MVSSGILPNSNRTLPNGQRDRRVCGSQERDSRQLVRVVCASAQVSQSTRGVSLLGNQQSCKRLLQCKGVPERVSRSQVSSHALLVDARFPTHHAQCRLLQDRVHDESTRKQLCARKRSGLLLLFLAFQVDLFALVCAKLRIIRMWLDLETMFTSLSLLF